MLRRILGSVARRAGLYKLINRSRVRRVAGRAMRIPVLGGVSCESSEPWMLDLLRDLLPLQEGTFLDIGVSLGQTLVKVKGIDPARSYIGFEPNPACVSYVSELIRVNDLQGCVVVPVGLFDQDTVLALELYAPNEVDPAASLIGGFRPREAVMGRRLVPVFRFDSLKTVLNPGTIGMVKIDVEGSELEVIKSLEGALREHRPLLLVEVLPVYSSDNAARLTRQQDLEKRLRELDYVLLRVRKTPRDDYAGLRRIETIGVHADLSQCDYVIAPSEQADQMESSCSRL